MFTPKVVSRSQDTMKGYFQGATVKTFDEVAEFVEWFTKKFGEPEEGDVWKAAEGFIHVGLRNERSGK